jgi:hypothetical protein
MQRERIPVDVQLAQIVIAEPIELLDHLEPLDGIELLQRGAKRLKQSNAGHGGPSRVM